MPSTTTYAIPAEFEAFIKDAIASGRYRSEEEVLNTALRIWREREEKLEELRAEIQIGIDQLENSQWSDGEEAIERILAVRRDAQTTGIPTRPKPTSSTSAK